MKGIRQKKNILIPYHSVYNTHTTTYMGLSLLKCLGFHTQTTTYMGVSHLKCLGFHTQTTTYMGVSHLKCLGFHTYTTTYMGFEPPEVFSHTYPGGSNPCKWWFVCGNLNTSGGSNPCKWWFVCGNLNTSGGSHPCKWWFVVRNWPWKELDKKRISWYHTTVCI
jgi:hypothetical protein